MIRLALICRARYSKEKGLLSLRCAAAWIKSLVYTLGNFSEWDEVLFGGLKWFRDNQNERYMLTIVESVWDGLGVELEQILVLKSLGALNGSNSSFVTLACKMLEH